MVKQHSISSYLKQNWCIVLTNYDILSYMIAVLMSSYTVFTKLGSGFWDPRYRPPPRARTPLSYIVHIRSTHIHANAFVGSMGGTILYKTFPNFYIFHCKNDCLNPKVRPFGI